MGSLVYTVTLNPALDVTLWLPRLKAGEPLTVLREKIEPAGKAVNVSRVMSALGVKNRLLGLCGMENQARFHGLLQEAGVEAKLLEVPGAVRENLTLILPDGTLYKIDRAGFPVTPGVLARLRELLVELLEREAEPMFVFAGSLPPGMTKEDYRGLISPLKKCGARIVLDNDFFTWEEMRELSPFLVKPNEAEFERLAARKFRCREELFDCACALSAYIPHILVSLGADGLFYAGGGARRLFRVPAVEVKSTVGAGDSVVAGFLFSYRQGRSIEECARYAAACGTAAVLTEGTGVLSVEALQKLLPQIKQESPVTKKQ